MLGPIIGAGIGLLGNLFGAKKQEDAQAAARASQEAMAAQNIAMQKEFAQSGIQWKVADAKAAGIHPLYAMGAQTSSYSPVTITSDGSSPMGKALAESSQDIGRAVSSTMSAGNRDDAFTTQTKALTLTKMGLENELLASQIAKQRAQIGPPMPTLGAKTLIDGQPATLTTSVGGASVEQDQLKQTADTVPETARIRPGGLRLYTNPWFSDAQSLENRYGEVGENVGGLLNLGGDAAYTLYRSWPRNDSGGAWLPSVKNPFSNRSYPRHRGRYPAP